MCLRVVLPAKDSKAVHHGFLSHKPTIHQMQRRE
jgi:hypothetical protein